MSDSKMKSIALWTFGLAVGIAVLNLVLNYVFGNL